ncbi:hypothetical protein OAD49_05295 [Flavobacteriaceae bacterium]|nr:hypothetical protein [Flavobacteriaceae bacterium]
MYNTSNLFLIIITILSLGCGSENNSENNKFFDSVMKVNENYGQFQGSVFIGNNSGSSFMVLENGKQKGNDYEKLIKLRYQLYSDIVDETFTVKDLKLYTKKTTDIGLRNSVKYANSFLKGNFRGLKNSVNNGRIVDSNSSGEVVFALDSIGKTLKYVMLGNGNYSYQGDIKLNEENHLSIKKVFNATISKDEKQQILKSYNNIEIFSDQLIQTSANSYKYLLSLEQIFENVKVYISKDRKSYSEECIMDSLFSFKIKNISDSNNLIRVNDRFYGSRMETTSEQDVVRRFSRGSSLGGREVVFEDFNKGETRDFTFNLRLNSLYVPSQFSDRSIFGLMDGEFLRIFNKALELPAILLLDKKGDVAAKIYFELVD